MKQLRILLITLCIGVTSASAQKGGPIVFTVGIDTVWGAEFERVYSKNNKNPEVRPTQEELEEYLDLYIKFKLKVLEAYSLGMEKNKSFKKELAGYRKQLAKPYLTDKEITGRLIDEAYARMKTEVDASNLMVHVSTMAFPEDTLKALQRIRNWHTLISEGKMTFEELARDSSTDSYGRKHEGRLDYFSAFNMIYPFENKAYTTDIGEMSELFRTQFGYHILKVNNKRPARGEVKVAHILIRTNNDSEYETKKPKIDAVYKRVVAGENWNDLVLQFTEDFGARSNGGEMNWIKSIGGNTPKELKELAFSLENIGDIAGPIKTELGWHIIKKLETKDILPYDRMKEFIKYKISRDSRSQLNKKAVLSRIQKENNYSPNQSSIDKYLKSLDSTIIYNVWNPGAEHQTNEVLFTIGSRSYTFFDMSGFAGNYKNGDPKANIENVRQSMFNSFRDESNLSYEEDILEKKYDDFKYLMQEYRDGILLFELTNKVVWKKASEDTVGLESFFNARRDDYKWKERLVYRTYKCSNDKTAKKVKKCLKKKVDDSVILQKLNQNDPLAVRIDQKVVERGTDSLIDAFSWEKNFHTLNDGSKNTVYLVIDEVKAPEFKELKETMGPVTSDYQDHLEKLWLTELRARYPVKVADNALDKLFRK